MLFSSYQNRHCDTLKHLFLELRECGTLTEWWFFLTHKFKQIEPKISLLCLC